MSQNLLIPLRVPHGYGFFDTGLNETHWICGHPVRLISDSPFYYIVLQNVAGAADAEKLVKVTETLLHWACVRVGFSMRLENSALRHGVESGMIVDGSTPTLFLGDPNIKPMRAIGSMTSQEGDVLLLRALKQGIDLASLGAQGSNELKIGCELFSAVDFEASPNAQFITLTSIMEILSKPDQRAPECLHLLNQMSDEAKQMSIAVSQPAREALESLIQSAQHWQKESFRGSIRKMAKQVAAAFNESDVSRYAREAVYLYDKRSGVVHRGENVSHQELKDLRQLVREALAVEIGCLEGIRDALS
jgi:hypothetical protein